MHFETSLQRYASLLLRVGTNLQPGQMLMINADLCHRQIVQLLVDDAYRMGASYVVVNWVDAVVGRSRFVHSSDEHLQVVPDYLQVKYDEWVDKNGAVLSLLGPESPDLFQDIDAKKLTAQAKSLAPVRKRYREEGIGKSQVHWCVAAVATEGWAAKIFPDLSTEDAMQNLWNAIFQVSRIDQEDPVQAWKDHVAMLQRRMAKLQALTLDTIHFQGPGTDLRVGLSPASKWLGGNIIGPHGEPFVPNVPTDEVFTTPDARRTEGTVRTTRPFLIHGRRVEGLQLQFEDGIITDFEAETGGDIFREHIDSDPGGRRLGEVALVGIDAPVYQTGLLFGEILYDENAACHVAIGNAYTNALQGGESMTIEERDGLGCNRSIIHTDMMISSEDVHVTGWSGQQESALLRNGSWVL